MARICEWCQQHQQQQQQPLPQNPAPVDPGVVGELRRLVGSMVYTQVLANIQVFKGLPKDFKRWIKDVERHVQAIGGDDNARMAVATQSASCVLSRLHFLLPK